MGRINSWLLRRMDKMPDPEGQLPPKLEQMHIIIGRRVSRAVLATAFGTAIYVLASRLLMPHWYGLLVLIPMILILSLAVMAVADYQSRMAVHDYMRWLRAQSPTRSRLVRMGAPYKRRPPVATLACQSCPATPGERHHRNCPAIPPEWYRTSRRG